MIVFRKVPHGTPGYLVLIDTLNILDGNNFLLFWISWINGLIQVGYGNVVGNGTFMTYNDSSPTTVNYIALTGFAYAGSAFIYNGW